MLAIRWWDGSLGIAAGVGANEGRVWEVEMGRKRSLGTTVRRPTKAGGPDLSTTCVGCYYFDEEEGPLLAELVVTGPCYILLPVGRLRLYSMPDGESPPEEIVPHFILDPMGEELIGSYLHPSMEEWNWDRYGPRCMSIRFACFVPERSEGGVLGLGGVIPFPDSEPIPERLLRLVWRDL